MDTKDKLIKRLKNTILIKAGDKRVKLGQLNTPPIVDCRVICEKLYKEVLSTLEQQVEEQECEHPFAFVQSRCFGEINHCLQCDKDL